MEHSPRILDNWKIPRKSSDLDDQSPIHESISMHEVIFYSPFLRIFVRIFFTEKIQILIRKINISKQYLEKMQIKLAR